MLSRRSVKWTDFEHGQTVSCVFSLFQGSKGSGIPNTDAMALLIPEQTSRGFWFPISCLASCPLWQLRCIDVRGIVQALCACVAEGIWIYSR